MKKIIYFVLVGMVLVGCNRWHVGTPDAEGIVVSSALADNQVLEANKSFILEGSASPKSFLVVRYGDYQKDIRVNAKGQWRVKLPKFKPQGPAPLHIAGAQLTTIRNISVK